MVRTFQIVAAVRHADACARTSRSARTCTSAAARAGAGERARSRWRSRSGMAPQLDKPAADLTVAGRKRLELARALATRPRLLLLDEVLAGLNPQEIAEMMPMVRGIADERRDGADDRARDAGRDEPGRARLGAGAGPADRRGQPAPGDVERPGVVEAYLGHGTAARLREAADRRHDGRCSRSSACAAATAASRCCAASTCEVASRRDRRAARQQRRRQVHAQQRSSAASSRPGAGIDPLRRQGPERRALPRAWSSAGLIQVPEGRQVFPNLSVLENLELGSFTRGRERARAEPGARVRHLPAPEGARRAARRHA